MKITIYLIAGVFLLFSCKKESSNPAKTPTSTTVIAKYGNGVNDIEGNKYKTVILGTQEWMGENLKTSKYNDGTDIPNVTDSIQWNKLTTGAWCNYNNTESLGKIYGKIYNWYVVSSVTNGNKNVCPTGWHIPSMNEWSILKKYLGSDTIAGGKMKDESTNYWESPNVGATNTSLFTALPGGARDGGYRSRFYGLKSYTAWWSSTDEEINFTGGCSIDQNSIIAYEYGDSKTSGLSIRCLKD